MASSSSRSEQDASVRTHEIPAVLEQRLGTDATAALAELFDRAYHEQRADMIAASTERFERRLVEETTATRLELSQLHTALRHDGAKMHFTLRQDVSTLEVRLRDDMRTMEAGLRQEMTRMEADLRQEMGKMDAGLRQEMGKMEMRLRDEIFSMGFRIRQELATNRVELFKWSFVFWIGQVLAMSAIVGVALRFYHS
jgi:hypothetical protein